jgi:Arc/MetJ family transcription regulator
MVASVDAAFSPTQPTGTGYPQNAGRTHPRPSSRTQIGIHLRGYRGGIGRTNIEIDDDLVSEAMRRYGLHSKRAAVDLALRRLVGESTTRKDALAMEGAGWEGDLEAMRSDP